ncbi:hypothetical protein AJ80_05433 [Polytolypa hystricis UAMH7299]|uniref:Mid2 domain-containing protein n=1 Tax=Polytolypa hystricis (strain UAMH7299) TaxID=1447883 RepID=A0A2B7Y3E3_POLH7|nr:hypothetical protein AJ80_05433 [Polytolypa hystricis UAMH7299]
MDRFVVLLLSSTILQFVLAEDQFIFPPNRGAIGEFVSNLAFNVGEQITLKWESDEPSNSRIRLRLMQDNPNGGNCDWATCEMISITENDGSHEWKVDRMGMTHSDVYYIFAHYVDKNKEQFNCHYFNITDSPTSTTSSAGKGPPTDTPGNPSSSSSSPSNVGAIVGGVLGGVALICITIFAIFFIRRKRRVIPPQSQILPPPPINPPPYYPPSERTSGGSIGPSELSREARPAELPSH